MFKLNIMFAVCLSLAACGGGGDSSSPVLGISNGASTTPSDNLVGVGGVSVGNPVGENVIEPNIPNVESVQSVAVNGDIVDKDKNIVPSAYRKMASQLSLEAGIQYRYGTSSEVSTLGAPTYWQRPSGYSRCHDNKCLVSWQVGGPRNFGDEAGDQTAAGNYSTNQGTITYVADNPDLRVGVTDIQNSAYEFNTFSQEPRLAWVNDAAPTGGLDSINVWSYRQDGLVKGNPIAQGRCTGRPGVCSTGLVAFQNGLIGTVGSNTARNKTTVMLPANKVPTSIAITNDTEFALATIWDTDALKGQIAVIALAGLCDGCKPEKPTEFYQWWDEWEGTYPGLPNMGNIAFMKVLGYVDLPDMKAPTEIAVTTGMDQFKPLFDNGLFIGRQTPLTVQANREKFLAGGSLYNKYSKSGVAVVVSKSEQKVSFIDLKPLFNYVNNMYFATPESEFKSTVINNLGQGEKQWPHTFSYKPQQMPAVIKTITLDQQPTAVKTNIYGDVLRAWVATKEGSLRIFSLDNLSSGGLSLASGIQEKGRVAIGSNTTVLATSKGDPIDKSYQSENFQVLLASRGERKIQWVRFSSDGNSGKVIRTLQDSRFKDPISVEEAENYATEGNVISVIDYSGKKVHNYRYGQVIASSRGSQWACQPPNGCPVTDASGNPAPFEYGGVFEVAGKPFGMLSSNVP